MDFLRRKRIPKAAPPPSAAALSFTPVSPATSMPPASSGSPVSPLSPASSGTTVSALASSSSTPISQCKSQSDMTVLSSSSRASSFDSSKSGFFQAMRSLSRGSTSSTRPSAASSVSTASTVASTAISSTPSPDSPTSTSPQLHFMAHVPRKVLRKSHKRMSSHELHTRRGSTGSDLLNRMSRSSNLNGSSSSNVPDWRVQPVEMHAALDFHEGQVSKNRIGYLAMTSDFLVLFRTRADAFASLPQLSETAGPKPSSMLPPVDPVHVIPLNTIISIFRTETVRPPHSIEIWWRLPHPAIATCGVTVYVKDLRDCEAYLDALTSMVKNKSRDQPDGSRIGPEVEECIRKVFKAEEPNFMASTPEIFPVVYRNTPDRGKASKSDDKHKKVLTEGSSSHFLVVGINLCFFVEIGRASAVQSTALEMRYQACGLVTLESFSARWSSRDERFAMRFRDPFKSPVGLELASRHCRRIILTLTKADKYLKPAWPTTWQMQEVFHVTGMPTPQHIVAGEDFGGLQRTLGAFCAAHHCDPVDWEINWRTAYAPEFRVLPSRTHVAYTDVQLLAVLRALRYNDYFKSLSFSGVDLSNLLDKYDSTHRGNVTYMSRSGVCLTSQEASLVQKASLLHQEFHALAFSSGTIRQIDFTNCIRAIPKCKSGESTVQFLLPILNLLAAGLTRCNRLFLRGCSLGQPDIESLAGYIAPNVLSDSGITVSQEVVSLEALDIANCNLSDQSLKMLFHALCQSAWTLTTLDMSQNFGRVPAAMVQDFMESVGSLRQLNLGGTLTGSYDGALLPLETLERLEHLEVLDVSNFKLNESSITALVSYIGKLSVRQATAQSEGYAYSLRRLVLSNCGITGHDAGRIFAAMAGLYDVHLHLSSNPLEQGIEDFARAIEQSWGGRFGLHLNMVEFQEEANYVKLINGLTVNQCIDYLSLAGTAPIPTDGDACGDMTVAALERFFSENQSVRYLDLSGFCGKLDDGQLGKGFGRAVRGLVHNKTLTHLRVRNQNLGDAVDALGVAVQKNTGLLFLDCCDNGFNATSLRYMAKTLQDNRTLLMYPISEEDVEATLQNTMKDIPMPPSPTRAPSTKQRRKSISVFDIEPPKALLREDIEAAAAEISSYMSRNIAKMQHSTGSVVEFGEALDTCGERGWPSLRLSVPEGVSMFTTTPMEEEEEDKIGMQGRVLEQCSSHSNMLEAPLAATPRQTLVSSVQTLPQAVESMPYLVSQDDEAWNSPTDGPSPNWDYPTTPSISAAGGKLKEALADGGEMEQGALNELELSGIFEKFTLADGSELFVCNEPASTAASEVV